MQYLHDILSDAVKAFREKGEKAQKLNSNC